MKVLMVRLDGGTGDEARLGAAATLGKMFDSQIIGLFLNPLPDVLPPGDVADGRWPGLIDKARKEGDRTEVRLRDRLRELGRPFELRRFDVYPSEIAARAAREVRTADCLIGLRLDDASDIESETAVEGALFGAGRHVFLAADGVSENGGFRHAMIAWNGGREAARALDEAMPYLHRTERTTVVVVESHPSGDSNKGVGDDTVAYLHQHGVPADLRRVPRRRDVATTLIEETGSLGADLVVMGGYGHSRLMEWLTGGTTHTMMRKSRASLVMAH